MIATVGLRINAMISNEKNEKYSAYYAKVGYSVVFGLFNVRILELFAAFPIMGPKLEMIQKMLMDLVFFMIILMVFVIAYGILAVSLLQPMIVLCGIENNKTTISNNTTVHEEDYSWNKVFSRPYWSLMGEIGNELDDIDNIKKTEGICKVFHNWLFPGLLALYLLVSSILLLNLLIAIFSQTFSQIHDQSEKIWGFNRYELLLEYR